MSRGEFSKLVTLVAGNDPDRRQKVVERFSRFLDASEERYVFKSTIEELSDKWAAVAVDRLKAAIGNGEIHALYDETGDKIQYGLFGE